MDDVLTKEEIAKKREYALLLINTCRLYPRGQMANLGRDMAEAALSLIDHLDRLSAEVTAQAEEIGVLKAQLAGMEGTLRVAMEDEAKLRAVVENLPLSADGVRVAPGMTLYWQSENPRTMKGIMVETVSDADAYWHEHGQEIGIPLEWAMSTLDAARAAHDAKAGKGAQS